MKFGWIALLLPTLLAACSGVPVATDQGMQDVPVSQQAITGDARRSAKAHTDLGMTYLRDGKFNIALDEAKLAIAADPNYPLGYNLLGLVQMYLQESRAAEESFNRALELAPRDPEINNNFGWFLCQAKREAQSFEYFDRASRSTLYPTPTKPLTNGAICATNIGDDKRAEDFALRALRADPQNNEVRLLLTEVLFRTGRTMEARQRLEEFHRITEPTSQSAWIGLRIARKLGDRESESRYATLLRRSFRDSREYQLLMLGAY